MALSVFQPTYMYQCPSGYIFRLRVPDDLRTVVGKVEFRYSLRSGVLHANDNRKLTTCDHRKLKEQGKRNERP